MADLFHNPDRQKPGDWHRFDVKFLNVYTTQN